MAQKDEELKEKKLNEEQEENVDGGGRAAVCFLRDRIKSRYKWF